MRRRINTYIFGWHDHVVSATDSEREHARLIPDTRSKRQAREDTTAALEALLLSEPGGNAAQGRLAVDRFGL